MRSPMKKVLFSFGTLLLANTHSLLKDGEKHNWISEAGIEEQSIVQSYCFSR
jgi:hypothetical protein